MKCKQRQPLKVSTLENLTPLPAKVGLREGFFGRSGAQILSEQHFSPFSP